MPSPDLPQRRLSSGLSEGGRFGLHDPSDRATASVRVYRPTPPHYQETCDEVLYCLSGRGTFRIGDPGQEAAFGPGQLLLFDRRTIHALPKMLEEPLMFLSADTPRREPTGIVFVDPEDGTPATFMARNAASRRHCRRTRSVLVVSRLPGNHLRFRIVFTARGRPVA